MPKMTIEKASVYFGVSKEAIHNRVRRGSLKSVVEDGIKYVMVEKNSPQKRVPKIKSVTTTMQNDRYYEFLEQQNAKLQSRVDMLENETRTLRDQKEQILVEERKKIEQIYIQKDEQLKNILNVISSKFMLEAPLVQAQDEQQHVEAEIEVQEEVVEDCRDDGVLSLKKYLKGLKLSQKKLAKIKHRFKKKAKKDERIIVIGKKYYIDISKYDYKDLLH